MPSLPNLPPPAIASTPALPTAGPAISTTPPNGLVGPGGPRSPDPKRRIPVGLLVALFAASVVGITGWFVLAGDPGPSDARTPAERPAVQTPDVTVEREPETAIGRILDDAHDVVDEVNANDQEEELLAELGLDATGNTVTIAPGSAGYRFTWADPSGQDLDIVVDSNAGNFSVVASDGISFRRIDGAYFGQSGSDGEWYQLADDPFGAIPVVGLDGIPTADEIVPASVEPYVVSTTVDGPTRVVMIDDAAFAAADIDARNDWLAPWGLIDETPESATSVIVRITFDSSGQSVVGAHVETPAIGGFAAFSIVESYETAPVIDNPLSALPSDEVAVDLGE
jgi:hypothetical protein